MAFISTSPHPAATVTALHVREHLSVLAALEKRALVCLARRVPLWIHSDHLTLLGLLSMAGAGAAVAALQVNQWAAAGAVVFLAANWLGDSLDGTLARVRGQERPRFGYYVDHVIDVAGSTFLLTGLAFSGVMNPLIALRLLVAYLLVSAESYLATHTTGVFRISFFGLGPTELRIVLAIGLLKAAHTPEIAVPGLGRMLLFDLSGILATCGLALVFVTSAFRNIRALSAAEPRPWRKAA
jgi:phosphatidylglycerophosphate synthase